MESYLTLMMEIVDKIPKEEGERALTELLLPLKTNSSAKETPAALALAIEIIRTRASEIFSNQEEILRKNSSKIIMRSRENR